MAEEDILWGKNRHFFGGIEPSNMRTFEAVANDVDGSPVVTITAEGPFDTVITDDYHNICEVGGYVIRKSETDYPKDEFDGELIYEETNRTVLRTITDSNVENSKVYYYAAFPYSKQGVYNRNKANRAIADLSGMGPVPTYVYGYDLDLDDSNPATRVTYPEGVDNYGYTPVAMNYTSSTFDYGSWAMEPGEKFMPKPCMLTYEGVVDHYLNPNDYAKKIDGTNSSVKSSSFKGNAMMEWPKIYTKRWETDGVYHFRCSDVKMDDDYECWCNYDANNNEIDHFYTAIYMGSKDSSNRIRSICTSDYGSKLSSEYYFDYAKNNGAGWHLETLSDFLLIQDLLVLMARSTDTQTAYGNGNSSSENVLIKTGTLNTKGMFWGNHNWSDGIKIFGMEHWWGNGARLLAGWMHKVSGDKYYFKITRGTKDGTTCTDYNYTGSGYLTSSGPGSTYYDGKYYIINKTTTTPYGRIPSCSSKTASSNMYECDSISWNYYAYDTSVAHLATVGGNTDMGNGNGAFGAVFNVRSGNGAYAMISCKPSATV